MDTQLQETIRTEEYVATGDRNDEREMFENNLTSREVPISTETGVAALFGADEAARFRARWQTIQTEFVDEPRRSVEQADQLVANVAQRLTQMFADHRSGLEREWDKGELSTEDLRTAFKRYRTLFDRLLSV